MVPGTRHLVNLIRGGGPHKIYASTCVLPTTPTVPATSSLRSCRPGVGDRFMTLIEIVRNFEPSSEPRTCNWSIPVLTNIPDAHSRTCASRLPRSAFRFYSVLNPHEEKNVLHLFTCCELTYDALPTSNSFISSSGSVYLVGNQNDDGRDPVTLSISKDGRDFARHWAVRTGAPPVKYSTSFPLHAYSFWGHFWHPHLF